MNIAHTSQMHHKALRNRAFWGRRDRMKRAEGEAHGALVNTHRGYFVETLPGGEEKRHYSIHPNGRRR